MWVGGRGGHCKGWNLQKRYNLDIEVHTVRGNDSALFDVSPALLPAFESFAAIESPWFIIF